VRPAHSFSETAELANLQIESSSPAAATQRYCTCPQTQEAHEGSLFKLRYLDCKETHLSCASPSSPSARVRSPPPSSNKPQPKADPRLPPLPHISTASDASRYFYPPTHSVSALQFTAQPRSFPVRHFSLLALHFISTLYLLVVAPNRSTLPDPTITRSQPIESVLVGFFLSNRNNKRSPHTAFSNIDSNQLKRVSYFDNRRRRS